MQGVNRQVLYDNGIFWKPVSQVSAKKQCNNANGLTAYLRAEWQLQGMSEPIYGLHSGILFYLQINSKHEFLGTSHVLYISVAREVLLCIKPA